MCTTVGGPKWSCLWEKPQKMYLSLRVRRCGQLWSRHFAWQAWHFVTFDVCEEECVCVCVRGRRGRKVKSVSFSTCQQMWSCRFLHDRRGTL